MILPTRIKNKLSLIGKSNSMDNNAKVMQDLL